MNIWSRCGQISEPKRFNTIKKYQHRNLGNNLEHRVIMGGSLLQRRAGPSSNEPDEPQNVLMFCMPP